ncbi:sec-independent protein translocase protein TatC [Desulfonatronum thiosulfatophilum]|uniref:Sec-independent protein translocase protein TatC n=2 Tax=Desulfonatronum thiosulfatophilum TaxID=617002 RepID=A0A1G6BYC3_9BACT|nr:twin-arginine translocase subunit TatC [Desulfonatronum thiosulfatophilum]SDB25600.1 sec-independent protein translocase protein TatC [Desulfonatronum thiosulfatophilum]
MSETSQQQEQPGELKEMTLMDHLGELRTRLVRSAIAALVGFLICYAFSKQLFELMMKPLLEVMPPDSSLIFTALPEAFFTYVKVAFVAGLFLVSPYIFYQIWKFIAPGLYESERKYMIPIAAVSALFFVSGALFGYFIVFPFGFEFFMGYADEMIRPMPSLREYFSFSLKLLLAFGFIFELPLFIFFLARMGLVTAASLRKKRKYAILFAFVIAAILTPPDGITQILMSGPLIILYEFSIFVALFFGKKPKVAPEAQA